MSGAETTALIAELGLRDRRKQKALSVPCPHCKAAAGDPCTVDGRDLKKSPAHPSRMDAVGLDIDLAERRETVELAR